MKLALLVYVYGVAGLVCMSASVILLYYIMHVLPEVWSFVTHMQQETINKTYPIV